MDTEPLFRFRGATPYAFSFEHAQLILLACERDDAKFLFRVSQHTDDEVELEYAGDTFSERVLDTVQSVFFIQVQEDNMDAPEPHVLGVYFEHGKQAYGAYYRRQEAPGDMVLFRIEGETEQRDLQPLEPDEYASVSAYFQETFLT